MYFISGEYIFHWLKKHERKSRKLVLLRFRLTGSLVVKFEIVTNILIVNVM